MTPDIASTIEVEFEDGRFVVPKWWANLPFLRAGQYVDGVRRVPFTIAEARIKVNNDLLSSAVRSGMRKAVNFTKGR